MKHHVLVGLLIVVLSGCTTPAPDLSVTYRSSGAFSPYEYYDLTIDDGTATFRVKPIASAEKRYDEALSLDELAALDKLIAEGKFFEATEVPRKTQILDIGETTLTIRKDGETHSVKETGSTVSSTDIRAIRQWLDGKVRVYLAKSGAKPSPKMSETPTK